MTGCCTSCARPSAWSARPSRYLLTEAGRLALRRLTGSTASAGLVELCTEHAGDYVVAGGVVDPLEAVTRVEKRDALEVAAMYRIDVPAKGARPA